MTTFTHKGYGRIYCEVEEDVARIHAVIKAMDDFEYSYMNPDLVAPFSEYPKVVYLGKFSDLDMNKVTAKCWEAGLRAWVFDSGHQQYPQA